MARNIKKAYFLILFILELKATSEQRFYANSYSAAISILRDFGEKQFRKIMYILNRSPTKKLHQLMKLGLEASQV